MNGITLYTTLETIAAMDNEQLNRVIEAVKLRRTYLTRNTVRSLQVGSRVEFNGRRGHTVGTVTKVNRKYVVVDCGAKGSWRVPGNMLSAAD